MRYVSIKFHGNRSIEVTCLNIGMLSYYSYRNSNNLLHLSMLLTLKKYLLQLLPFTTHFAGK